MRKTEKLTMENELKETGNKGEEHACRYLSSLGHTIVERNWRSSHLEIDIISVKGHVLHIVEVKSRTAPAATEPEDNVTHRKQERLVRAANAYLHSVDKRLKAAETDEVSFDVVSVLFEDTHTTINYFPGAFTPIYYGK